MAPSLFIANLFFLSLAVHFQFFSAPFYPPLRVVYLNLLRNLYQQFTVLQFTAAPCSTAVPRYLKVVEVYLHTFQVLQFSAAPR
jgi:hypothetical protein